MGIRRIARENALRSLYIIDVCGMETEEAIRVINNGQAFSPEIIDFSGALIRGAVSSRQNIDEMISQYSQNWTIERMPSIDRNIIRIAAFELIHMKDTPINVIINEAVEIAKKFSTIESGKFVNGVLDKIKVIREEKIEHQGT